MKKLYGNLCKFEEVIVCTSMFLVTMLIFLQVLNRYVGHFEVLWLNDSAIYLYIFCMSLNWAYATYKEGHCSVEILQEVLFKRDEFKVLKWSLMSKIYSLIATIVFAYLSYPFFKGSLKYTQRASLMPWFHENWLQSAFYGAMFLVIIHLIFSILSTCKQIAHFDNYKEDY